jgi:hypothetical protein
VEFVILFAACTSSWAAVWEERHLGSAGQTAVLEVELYRGIVRFHPGLRGESATLKAALVSYDDYRPGDAIDALVRPLPKGVLELTSSPGTARIAAPTLRDLVVVDLRAPAATELRIHIVHYGEVTVEDALGEVEVNLFQGLVDLRSIRGPAVVHIVRDGSIHARLTPPVADSAMAFTTYEGDIVLEAPEAMAQRFQITSARGVIHNEFETKDKAGPPAGEPILIRNAKGKIHVHPLR